MIQAGIPQHRIETIIRNTENIAKWRQKMRCKTVVDEVGEYGSYPDLRSFDQRWAWIKIKGHVKALRRLGLVTEASDIPAGVRLLPQSSED